MIRNLVLLSAAAVSTLQADFLRMEGGIGSFAAQPSGNIRYESDASLDFQDDLDAKSGSDLYVWTNFKHFFPLLPNLRLEYTGYGSDGKALLSGKGFGGTTFDGTVRSQLRLNQKDVVLYYNLLDETFWSTVDVGVNVKAMDGKLTLESDTASERADLGMTLPMLYGRARVNLPGTPVALEADLKYLSYGGAKATDGRIKVEWTVASYAVDFGLEAGIRSMNFTVDEDLKDGTNAEIRIQGVFYGMNARF